MNMDLRELLNKASEAVRRDLNHIFLEASQGKLSPASARDLVAYTKLLSDVLEESEEGVIDASEEELKRIANETNPNP